MLGINYSISQNFYLKILTIPYPIMPVGVVAG